MSSKLHSDTSIDVSPVERPPRIDGPAAVRAAAGRTDERIVIGLPNVHLAEDWSTSDFGAREVFISRRRIYLARGISVHGRNPEADDEVGPC